MKQIGKLEGRIIKLLGLEMPADLPIYIGESNVAENFSVIIA